MVYRPILTENFVIVGSPDLNFSDFRTYLAHRDLVAVEKWLVHQQWYAYSNDLAFIRRFWLVNFKKRPLIIPQAIMPDLRVILQSVSYGNGISILSDYLVRDFIKEKKVVVVWEGIAKASNTLYLAYDKSKVSAQKILEMDRLFQDFNRNS